jgi:hypothetical protein
MTIAAEITTNFWTASGYRYPNKLGAPGVGVKPQAEHPVTALNVKSLIISPSDGIELGERGGDVIAGELSDPAFRIHEQTDRGELGRRSHVEPMRRSSGDAEQIALRADRLVNLAINPQVERRAALDEEAYLVLGVRVLVQELLAQRRKVRRILRHANHVGGRVAVLLFQPFDVAGVGRDDRILIRRGRQRLIRIPSSEDSGMCRRRKRL